MMDTSSNDVNGYYPITIVKKDSNLLLTLPPSSQQQSLPSLKIVTWKDEKLEYLDISKGLVEVLHTNGFTVEKILEYGPSQIAKILGIDEYVAQIIFNETSKTISNNIMSNNFLISYNFRRIRRTRIKYNNLF
ncbi:MAG TPA: hypothetical protein VF047_09695 [Nitrososphaeraceae archaeon]